MEKSQLFITKTVIQQLLKIKTLLKYPEKARVGIACLIQILGHLDFKAMPATFSLLVEKGNKIFLKYVYHFILVHSIKNISPNQLVYLLMQL